MEFMFGLFMIIRKGHFTVADEEQQRCNVSSSARFIELATSLMQRCPAI
jgi:hypothetical protein